MMSKLFQRNKQLQMARLAFPLANQSVWPFSTRVVSWNAAMTTFSKWFLLGILASASPTS
jgi:hypothetical protein